MSNTIIDMENIDIIGGNGISIDANENIYTISADSSASLTDELTNIDADSIQEALDIIASKLNNVDCIVNGQAIKALSNGSDPEYPDKNDLLPYGLYIRLETTSGKHIYVSAYEIDKAIRIIGDMTAGKANAGDLEALEIKVDTKASITQVSLLESELNSKADQDDVEALIELADTKADKSTVETLITNVNSKADKSTVEMLYDDVETKASISDVNSLKSDVEALENTLKALNDNSTIVSIKNQIKHLNDEINKRLTIDDINDITDIVIDVNQRIEDAEDQIEAFEADLSRKANITYVQSQVTELNGAITAMSSRINSKADKKEVATKASQIDLDIVVKKLTDLTLNTENDFAELENCCKIVKDALSKKASQVSVDAAVSKLESAILLKADKSDINDEFVKLNNKINKVETTALESISDVSDDVYELECEVNNELASLRATVDMHERNIINNADNITKLQDADYKYEQTMKNEWVRVMTPEAYNRLAPVGTSYSDGTLDPYAKQANVIYMLVRYNKPIAVYIGEILIAQAEEKGPQGFAYKFPIIF